MTATIDVSSALGHGAQLVAQLEQRKADHVEQATAVLQWAAQTFGDRLVVLSSMGDEVLVHLASDAVPGINVAFIDTDYHFAETIGTRDAYAAARSLTMLTLKPLLTIQEQAEQYGPDLYKTNPDQCCAIRKVEPLNRALADVDAWVTGMRREDAPTRADIQLIEEDKKRKIVKLNPLASWTSADLDDYIAEHKVLLNPLRQLGYTSIGCEPCTRAVAPGEDPRAGRWAGTDKTECGLHT